jgi:PAS domain S-box-containing protein
MRDGYLPPLRYMIQAMGEQIFPSPKQNGSPKKFHQQRHIELYDATEGIIMINTEEKIIQVNDPAAILFRYRAAELQGRPIQVLIPDVDFSGSLPANSILRPEGHVARKKNGIEFHLELMVSYSQCPQKGNAFIWVSVRPPNKPTLSSDHPW